jgi:putative FmdB family regulatory protein
VPTYLYECRQCETTFEIEQRITDEPLKDCRCGGEGTVRRLIQPTAVMFKGSGFYVNDSAPKPAEAPACSGEPSSCQRCSD